MRGAALLVSLVVSSPALAYTYRTFYGWSADGSYYASSDAGHDEVAHPAVCLSDPKVPSSTWPKSVAPPGAEDGCTSLCDENLEGCTPEATVQKLVRRPKRVSAGPHGELVQLTFTKTGVRVTVTRQGETIGEKLVELDGPPGDRPGVQALFWRADGGAAAVYLGGPEVASPGWPPPRYLAVIALGHASRAGAAMPADRAGGEAANARGMKLYRQKQYEAAAGEFRRAVAADASYVLAHYNLACVAALTGDAAAAAAELEWLAASTDALARTKLAKAKSDPDLLGVIDRPEVRAVLGDPGGGAAGCAARCERAQDRCIDDCDRLDRQYVRGCARVCTSRRDECSDACPAH